MMGKYIVDLIETDFDDRQVRVYEKGNLFQRASVNEVQRILDEHEETMKRQEECEHILWTVQKGMAEYYKAVDFFKTKHPYCGQCGKRMV